MLVKASLLRSSEINLLVVNLGSETNISELVAVFPLVFSLNHPQLEVNQPSWASQRFGAS